MDIVLFVEFMRYDRSAINYRRVHTTSAEVWFSLQK